MKNKFYSCPLCAARHSTEAWTYRTRLALGILDLDSEDILHLNELEYIVENDVKNEFACPTCGDFTSGIDLKQFDDEVVYETIYELKNLLLNLQLQEEMMVCLDAKSDEKRKITVEYHHDGWTVNYSNEEGHCDTFTNIDETIHYILREGVVKLF